GTRTNWFLVEKGRRVTPDLSESGVRGTVRQFLLEYMPVSVEPVSLARLKGAEELFVCNSVVGIWPVVSLVNSDGIGQWSPGPVTRSAQALLTEQTGMQN
ncbi:MAG: aminotransferase class IV, partial [Pseudomonadales bacterium]|nr:aminotransferase class IV [Pseudomonadales bacterium]